MILDATEIDAGIVYNMETGKQTLKIIDIQELEDRQGRTYLHFRFVNEKMERYAEPMYPDKQAKKIYQIARAVGGCVKDDDGRKIVDTRCLIGGYFKCDLFIVKYGNGKESDRPWIRNIRSARRRKYPETDEFRKPTREEKEAYKRKMEKENERKT
jgi:hypothetical protein